MVKAAQLMDVENMAKELADLLYVVYGTGVSLGIDLDKVFDAVHRSNMTKSKERDSGGKVTKGKDYEPPDIKDVLVSTYRWR